MYDILHLRWIACIRFADKIERQLNRGGGLFVMLKQAELTAEQLHRKKVIDHWVYVVGMHALLVFFSIIFVFPLFWMLSVSLQTAEEMMTSVGFWEQLIPNYWRFMNYVDVFNKIPFLRYYLNSAIITVSCLIGTVASSSIVAYAFSRLRWPGREICFNIMLATIMLPSFVLLVPTYTMYSAVGFIDTWIPLILPSFLGGGATNVLLIVQFYKTVPQELSEAAKIDGAGHLKIWSTIMLPLCKPVIATVAIFTFLFTWNDFMNPLIYINSDSLYTISLGIKAFQSQSGVEWGYLMAASVISMIPALLVFIFAQKYFVEGVKTTGLKS